MALQKAYSRINWENYPSDSTPINEANLNRIDSAVNTVDNRVIALDTTKASRTEVSTLVSDVTFDSDTGIFTVKRQNGSSFTIDTKLEKIAINFSYNANTQQIIIMLDDGTKQYIDLSALITQYEFIDTSTIAFEVNSDGEVAAKIKNASVTEDMLQPNFLADIKVEVAKAEKSQEAAAISEGKAALSEAAAKVSENNAGISEAAAKESEEAAKESETAAALSEDNAKQYMEDANLAAVDANVYKEDAMASATSAKNSADSAEVSAQNALASKNEAAESEAKAQTSAENALQYATGSTNSSKYYYEQVKGISEGISGAIQPHGTLKFTELPLLEDVGVGWMYNISDEFVTTSDFTEGAGVTEPAGSNVYKTADGKWDILAGTPVTGVKGANETTFRRGNVNITKDNVGLGNVPDVTTNNQTPTYTVSTTLTLLKSGEILSVAFGKIAKAVTDLISHLADTVKHITSSERTKWNNAVDNVETHTEQLSALQNTGIVNDSTDWDTLESGHYAVYCNSPLSEDNHAPVGAYQWGNLHVIKHIIRNGQSSGNQIYIENSVPPKIYFRSHFENYFGKWESVTIQSYTDNCVMGNVVDITQYTSNDNAFTCPSDGYLALAISNKASQWINVLINAGGFTFTTGICTPASTNNSVTTYRHVYLRKGMKLYVSSLNKATDGLVQANFIQFKY